MLVCSPKQGFFTTRRKSEKSKKQTNKRNAVRISDYNCESLCRRRQQSASGPESCVAGALMRLAEALFKPLPGMNLDTTSSTLYTTIIIPFIIFITIITLWDTFTERKNNNIVLYINRVSFLPCRPDRDVGIQKDCCLLLLLLYCNTRARSCCMRLLSFLLVAFPNDKY